MDDILREQKFQLSGSVLDKDIIAIGELAAAEEALILEIIHFGQKGVPLEKKNSEDKKKPKRGTGYHYHSLAVAQTFSFTHWKQNIAARGFY